MKQAALYNYITFVFLISFCFPGCCVVSLLQGLRDDELKPRDSRKRSRPERSDQLSESMNL